MSDFTSKVLGAASQGAVGAVVAASLSAVTEPIVNRVLVNRVPLLTAVKELDSDKVFKYMKTTMATNFIKFPFFEATNVIMSGVEVPPALRGAVTGTIFCSTTLPITNYRFRKSMGMPINPSDLYQAYLPTVLRDIIYGIVRNKTMTYMVTLNLADNNSNKGRFLNMFVTVIASCVISAPGNELRGYVLQPPAKRQAFSDFFQPSKFVRSTSIGALIMAVSLGVGTLATPQVEKLWNAIRDYMKTNPVSYLLVLLFAIHQILEARRNSHVCAALEDDKDKKRSDEKKVKQ
eukprot:gnl/TRDRNA2_/TRDRNA2_176781_c0_seq2.p1 gnl/TRDRNA2_/TRDRNA2_176781_c0~~gnl/TRDRNA2_/TRDRNA2_176781_c0_seq2.p1  ORF type:complete len:290 (-),score=62.67 gnl/TRDRNA2_/TRDRNA2_176781_c0_seq2:546-1415(-)